MTPVLDGSRARGAIVIGGSAGSIAPLRTILSALPRLLAVPIVVVIHRGRETSAAATLAQTLTASSTVRVAEVEDLADYQPDVVWLAPPGYHTLEGPDGPVLTSEPREHHSLPSIAAAFDSAFDTFGSQTVCVALSCANLDGAAAARRVLSGGGTVLVQSPEMAEYPALVDELARTAGVRIGDPDSLAAWVAAIAAGGS